MADQLLNSRQSRVLRWIVMITAGTITAALIVPIALGMILPTDTYRKLPETLLFWLVVGVAAAMCVVVAVRTRRTGAREAEGGRTEGEAP
ncbi:hypothetical protein [Streptomyces sp. NPDC006879]|uniref:hypothetical protein n=1 Tax=Streptomyces sp. NPDC006879 TaxID=3364767 RepID=UPI00369453EF